MKSCLTGYSFAAVHDNLSKANLTDDEKKNIAQLSLFYAIGGRKPGVQNISEAHMYTLFGRCGLLLGSKQNGTMLSMIGHTLVALKYSEVVSSAFFTKYGATTVWEIVIDGNSSQDKKIKAEFAKKFVPLGKDLSNIFMDLATAAQAGASGKN